MHSDCFLASIEDAYVKFSEQMYYSAYSILQDNSSAEDVVHDIFSDLIRKKPRGFWGLQNDDDVCKYLTISAKNRAITKVKSNSRFCSLDSERLFRGRENSKEFVDCLCNQYEYNSLIERIKNMPREYSEILYLRFVLDIPPREIAKMLNRKTETVKKQIYRGKAILLAGLEGNKDESHTD